MFVSDLDRLCRLLLPRTPPRLSPGGGSNSGRTAPKSCVPRIPAVRDAGGWGPLREVVLLRLAVTRLSGVLVFVVGEEGVVLSFEGGSSLNMRFHSSTSSDFC